MGLTIHPDPPPLWVDEAGAVRVGDTRVLLVLVVEAYKDGATAEEIVLHYDALDLADVYGAISYYLRHRAEVEQYIADYNRAADELREKVKAAQKHLPDIRELIQARRLSLAADAEARG